MPSMHCFTRYAALAGVLSFTTAIPAVAQQLSLPGRGMGVKTCAAADSALGPMGNEKHTRLMGSYDAARQTTYLATRFSREPTSRHPAFRATIWYLGKGPVAPNDSVRWAAAEMGMTIWEAGKPARALLDKPHAALFSLLVDGDTLSIGHVGKYTGPRSEAIVPVSFPLRYGWFLRVLRGKDIEVHHGTETFTMSDKEHRDLYGLFRAAFCTGAPQ